MEKRTPGAPLSEAEIQQRREAAKARWDKAREVGTSAAGAALGAVVAEGGIRLAVRRTTRSGEAQAQAATQRGEARVARHELKAKRQKGKAAGPWPMGAYARFNQRQARLAEGDLASIQQKTPAPERLPRQRPYATFTPEDAALRADLSAGKPVTIPPGPAYNKLRRRVGELREIEAVQQRWPQAATAEELRRFPSTQALTEAVSRARSRVDRAIPKQGRELSRPGTPRPGKPISPEIAQAANAALQRLGRAQDRALRANTLTGKPPDPKRWKIAGSDARPIPQRAQGPVEGRLWADAPFEPGGNPDGRTRRTRAWPTKDDLSTMRAEMRAGIDGRHNQFAARERTKASRRAGEALATARAKVGRIRAARPKLIAAGAITGAAAYAAARWGQGREVEKLAKADTPSLEERRGRLIARVERTLANRLGGLLRAWTESPATAGRPEQVEEAISDPIRDIFERMGGLIIPPPPRSGDLQAVPGDPGAEIGFSFEARSPRVEQLLTEYSFDLIRDLSDQSRAAVRTAMTLGAVTGATIPEQARLVRQSVGLSPGQVVWVNSYRQALKRLDPAVLDRSLRDARFDPTIRRAIETGTPLTEEQIERYVDAYHRRTLAYRATTIARTEGIRATNNATVAQARAMIEQDPDLDVEKEWIAADDERVRHTHRRLNGQKVIGMDTPFTVQDEQGAQVQIRWPHDPMAPADQVIQCRCVLGLRVIRRTNRGQQAAAA